MAPFDRARSRHLHRARRLLAGALFALLASVVVTMLPGPLTAYAADTTPQSDICFLDSTGQRECPPPASWPQPSLLNPAVYDAATPPEAQALRDTEAQALAAVLKDHQLPATDLPQVKSYARPDAQAEMWAIIVDALKTPAGQRTADQQALVDWMSDQVTQQRFQPAKNAAMEYARFAGKDLIGATQVLNNGTEQQITDFLSGPAEPFSDSAVDPVDPRPGGYCKYHPPGPYSGDYDEHTLQTCFTPCQSPLGCAPPTPTFDDFVKWGQATIDEETNTPLGIMNTPSFATQSAAIAAGTVFGTAAVGAGVAVASSTVLGVAVADSALAAAIFPYAGLDMFTEAFVTAVLAGDLTYTPFVGAVSAGAVGAIFAVVTVDIAILAFVGIQVANIDQLPAELAALATQARSHLDASTLVDTASGVTSLYTLFVAATLPVPKVGDPTCDPSGISKAAYNYRTLRDGSVEYWPLGSDETKVFDVPHCLNPVPVRPAALDDPHFVVIDQSTGTTSSSPDITVASPESQPGAVLRVSGSWWVGHEVGSSVEGQSLAMRYTDWSGDRRSAWLEKDDNGYRFFGYSTSSGGGLSIDKDTCLQDGSCFISSEIQYVGSNGDHYSAHLVPYVPSPATTVPSPTGQPGYSADTAFSGSAVSFASGGFAPPNAVGPMTYSWRFQKDGCGIPCQNVTPNGHPPEYTDPVAGANASHAWQTSGTYTVELTATDHNGRSAVTTFDVPVQGVAPTLTLAKDCRALSVQVACNDYQTAAGATETLFGGVSLAGGFDNVRVWVDWGDGTSGDMQSAGDHILGVDDHHLTLTRQPGSGNTFLLNGTHVYAQPGFYHVVVHAVNQAGQTDTKDLQEEISGPQTVTFAQLGAGTYGQRLPMSATGGASGIPVTYTAEPSDVCRASDDLTGSRVSLVGIGTCTVTAHQAGGGPVFGPADPVSRSFQVRPAPLTVTADDATKVYGAPNPTYTAHVTGLANADTQADLTGLTFTGPATTSGAGSYDIVPSGVTDPNYTVQYHPGRLQITRAPLTITPENKTRVYGAGQPAYTASFDGLVNGDTPSAVTGLTFNGAPPLAHVGTYDITAANAKNPNYDVVYRKGTETVTPASLTVTANDVSHAYGGSPSYSATYQGLVNGERALSGLRFAGAPAGAGVGKYPIVPSGSDPDYAITFVNGTETLTPAPLKITADNQTRSYGNPSPVYTLTFAGLQNGDTRASLGALKVTGAPARSGVGAYPITPSGAANPNYTITYVNGTETVTKALLTVTADNQTKVYGAKDPKFTATYQGLVNGDGKSVVTGLGFTTAPAASHVGTYPITPQGATSPNYTIAFVPGTETITPHALTIKVADKKVAYGTMPTLTWKGQGWVEGDSDATIDTPPTCQATVDGAPVSATTVPGSYPGALTCSGAGDSDYVIGYTAGTLTVDPVISLSQTGLPSTVPTKATRDGKSVSLPTGDVEVGFGTAHSYSFPAVVTDRQGVAYLTQAPGFMGTVGSNLIETATYTTMSAVLAAAVTNGGLDQSTATALTTSWNTVQTDLKAGNRTGASDAVKSFAGSVRAVTGSKIQQATADNLLANAQLVYTFAGGTGTL